MKASALARRVCALALAVVAVYFLLLTGSSAAAEDALVQFGENDSLVLAIFNSQLHLSDKFEFGPFTQFALAQSSLLQNAQSYLAQGIEPPEPSVTPDSSPTPESTYRPISEDPEDPAEEQPISFYGDTVLAKQFLPSESYEHAAGVYLFNRTSKTVDMSAIVNSACPVTLQSTSEPQVLIIHSHGTEAYQPTQENPYTPTDPYRTDDYAHNVTRVGEEVKTVLEGLGIGVVHDKTLHDYPNYNGSYTRSANTIAYWLEQYPSIQIVLDIHRDAVVGENGEVYKALTNIDGEDVAQVLLIVGTDEGGQTHDNWSQNLVFAADVQQAMNLLYPTLARPITLRTSRFNQQYRVGSLLVEVGTHGNTLEECIAAARHFARSLGLVLMQNKV